jgi:hypothetical protein
VMNFGTYGFRAWQRGLGWPAFVADPSEGEKASIGGFLSRKFIVGSLNR